MFNRRLSYWIVCAAASALLLTGSSLRSQEKLPDAPAPQNNAPIPQVSVPTPDTADNGGESSSGANPQPGPNTRPADQGDTGQPIRRRLRPARSRLRPSRRAGDERSGSGVDELFKLRVNVNFVSVPVTVKDHEGHS